MDKTVIGFCIYIDSLVGGRVPFEWAADFNPVTYPNRVAAEREIAEVTMERIRQFLVGEREFEDAMTVEEYVVEVDILSNGSIVDESGNHFGTRNG